MTAAGMAAAAWLISLGMYLEDGFYSRPGLVLVSLAIVVCAATMWGQKARAAAPPPRLADAALAAALVVEARLLVVSAHATPRIQAAIALVCALALLQAIDLARWRKIGRASCRERA